MKKHLIITIAVVLAFVSVFTMGPANGKAGANFDDVNSIEVNRLVNEGIIEGFPGNEFRPLQNVTRAEAAVMIGRTLELSEQASSTKYSDVSITHYAAGYISSASDQGIISGYTDGTYRPNQTLTRGEMAAVLTRSFNYEKERSMTFKDMKPGDYFYSNIIKLANSGVTAGYPDGTYGPKRSINRIEFSLMLARTLYPEYRPEVESVDVEGTIATGTVVRTNSLNVRPDNSTNYSPVGKFTEGTKVNVHEIVGNWALVSSGDIRGYVSQYYLTLHDGQTTGKLHGKTIVVDAGHGGSDPGGSGNSLVEKELALDVSQRLEAKLIEAGANVIMTRRSDWYPSLGDRIEVANNSGADIFISVHFNAFLPEVKGTETFYNSTYWAGDSKKLAEALQKEMLEKLQTVDRGVKTANFQVIKYTKIPSALVELGFMTNYEEAKRINTVQFREDGAEALLDGIFNYFK